MQRPLEGGDPRIDKPVGQNRKDDDGHGKQKDRRTKFSPGQVSYKAVKPLARGEHKRRCNAGRPCHDRASEHRVGAKKKRQQSGNRFRCGDVVLLDAFTPLEDNEPTRKRKSDQTECRAADYRIQGSGNPAEQADQSKRPNARGARTVRFIALAPSALDADKKSDGECDADTLNELGHAHG